MEVLLGTILLGFAVLVTALVVSLHYHRKYSPILRQMSEQLAINTPKKTADDANTTEDADDANTTEDADEKLFRQVPMPSARTSYTPCRSSGAPSSLCASV